MRIKRSTGVATVTLLVLGIFFVFTQEAKSQPTNISPAVPETGSTNASSSPAQPTPPADGLIPEIILQKSKATYAALQSYSDTGTVVAQVGSFSLTTNFKTRLQRPSLYLIEWKSSTGGGGVVWSDGTGDFLDFPGQGSKKQDTRERALAGATGISGGAAATIPASFFGGGGWGDQFSGKHLRETDEALAGIDCYVLTRTIKAKERTFSTTLWIGKQDALIHQIKTVTKGMDTLPPIEDESLKKVLVSQGKPVTPEAIGDLRKTMVAAQEMAKKIMQSGDIESLETHTDIVTDKTFTPDDFKPSKP